MSDSRVLVGLFDTLCPYRINNATVTYTVYPKTQKDSKSYDDVYEMYSILIKLKSIFSIYIYTFANVIVFFLTLASLTHNYAQKQIN